jgi:hypothetical protein
MADLLRYAVEIDLRGNFIGGAWEHTQTNATFGFYGGFIRACTGTANLTIEGQTFRPGFLLEQFKGERQAIDITEGGNYATFSTLEFSLNNVGGLWEYLRQNGIFTKNAPVRFWAVQATTPYLRWVGVVDDDSFGIDELKLSCIDASKVLHKTLPPETLNPAAFGWVDIEEESKGAAIPVCVGRLQDALLLPATKAENRFQGTFLDKTWNAVGHIAYFPSQGLRAPDSLQRVVVCVGLAEYQADAFAGRYIRAISGTGEGIVRRVVSSSVSKKIATWSDGDGRISGLRAYNIFGVQLELDSAWEFDTQEFETDAPSTYADWSSSSSYPSGAITAFDGQVFQSRAARPIGSDSPAEDGVNWFVIFGNVAKAQGDTAFCDADSAVNNRVLATGDFVPLLYPNLVKFDAGVTIIEAFTFDATLIASQRPILEIDLVRDTAQQRAGLRTIKDGATIPLPDIGDAFTSGLFSGRSYSGVRLSRASFAADKKLTAAQRIGSVYPMGCFMGATIQGNTPTGYISYTWNPQLFLQPDCLRLNDPDPLQYLGDEFNYSFIDSAGVTYSEVGKFPSLSPNYATAWDIHALVRTLPDADEISGAKDIIPALQARLFIDCPAAASFRVTYGVNVKVRSTFLGRLLFEGGAVFDSKVLSIGAAGTIEDEISLFSFFDKNAQAKFAGLLDAIKIDSVVSGKRLRDWLEGIDCLLIVRIQPLTFIAGIQPYLRVYEGGLAAKGDIELGAFRTSLQGEVWGDLDLSRYPADATPATFPAVAEYFLRAYDGLTSAEIDTASIDALLPVAALQSIDVSRQIVDAKGGREYLIELAAQGLFGIVQNEGKRAFRSWTDERTPVRAFNVGATDPREKIVDGSLQDVAKVPLSKLPTEARIRFNYSTADKKYLQELFITNTDKEAFPAIDEVSFGGSAVAEVYCMTDLAVNLYFAGAAPAVSFGDLIGFTAGGVQYVGVASAPYELSDGTEAISVWGLDSAYRELYRLPLSVVGSTFSAQPVQPLGGFLWQTFAQGFDSQHYADAKAIWERFRNAYKRVRQVQPIPARLGDCPWIHSSDINGQDIGSAVLYLDRVSNWVTKPREEVAFEVQAQENLDILLLDPVSFEDPLLFGGSVRLGWVTEIYLLPNRGTLGLQVILDSDPLDPYTESGDIDEGYGVGTIGNAWGDIDEDADAADIDEQGGF